MIIVSIGVEIEEKEEDQRWGINLSKISNNQVSQNKQFTDYHRMGRFKYKL